MAVDTACGGTRRPSVLVVDPDRAVRELLRTVLQHAGYDVRLAEDPWEAAACARQAVVDVLLMDASVPDRRGWSPLPWPDGQHRRPEVILMTGDLEGMLRTSHRPDRLHSAVEILEKPFDVRTLRDTVRRVLAAA
jgi:DNA-binding NtrC family response regulator